MNKDLNILQKTIKYRFGCTALLKQALIHPSYSGEMHMQRFESNQRLEFLGDAVLELVISDYLYKQHPETEEGELTRMRASLVFEAALAVCAEDIGLGEFIYLGKGEDKSSGRSKPSILSDTFEAVIGAIYMDGGMEHASEFIYSFLISNIDELSLMHDGKSAIQEIVQRNPESTLSYVTETLQSPDHQKKFRSFLYIDGKQITEGFGHSKKNAEQDAAIKAVRLFQAENGI